MSLDEDLLEQSRKRAVSQGMSMTVIINRALRRGLAESDERREVTATLVSDSGPSTDTAVDLHASRQLPTGICSTMPGCDETMAALIDVCILLAVLRADHPHPHRGLEKVDRACCEGPLWCSHTRNGFLRLATHPWILPFRHR